MDENDSSKSPGLLGIVRDQVLLRFGRRTRGLTERALVPRILMLETSSQCNLACEKCGHRTSQREKGLISLELAVEAIDQAAAMKIPWVCLSMLGEPLLHPGLEDIIAHVRSLELKPYFVTNALLLSPERSERLIAAGVERIVVSLDGWDAASYQERQGNQRLDRVLANLDRFRELRGAGKKPELSSISIIDAESQPRWLEIKNLLSSHVDECRISPLIDFGDPAHALDRSLLPGVRSWRRTPCPNLFRMLNVRWDGTVTACCNDHNNLLAYQRFDQTPLREIWQDAVIREFRGFHLAREFGRMPLCGACTMDYENSFDFQLIKRRFLKA